MTQPVPFVERAADALLAWHTATAGGHVLPAPRYDQGVIGQVATDLNPRLEASPVTLSLRIDDGTVEQQARRHLAAVLRKAFTDVEGLESRVRDQLDHAEELARTAARARQVEPAEGRGDGRYDVDYDDDLDRLRDAFGGSPRSNASVRHTSTRRDRFDDRFADPMDDDG